MNAPHVPTGQTERPTCRRLTFAQWRAGIAAQDRMRRLGYVPEGIAYRYVGAYAMREDRRLA